MNKQLKIIYTLTCAFTSIQKVNIAGKVVKLHSAKKKDYVKSEKNFYALKFCLSGRDVEQMNSNIRSEHVLATSFVMRMPHACKK
ncbi:hypothetical protein T4D_2578 [Trichinella pseudospiralis]|uniref:Uncharacterized protein n=1 Tax=Trichinella pseudospiralis TaxID=6337 RepID=A0A0V1FCR6_TRIPS|nr:hypothetical protein T4D_2578 [Trichinella pseudospiralis]